MHALPLVVQRPSNAQCSFLTHGSLGFAGPRATRGEGLGEGLAGVAALPPSFASALAVAAVAGCGPAEQLEFSSHASAMAAPTVLVDIVSDHTARTCRQPAFAGFMAAR